MKLIQIYECLCDETRLRILNLLSRTPLCVSHLQKILHLTQVKVSKHLNYLKERGIVEARRHENWNLYSLSKHSSVELDKNLRCLHDCTQEYSIFKEDLKRLSSVMKEVSEIKEKFLKSAKR